MNILHIASFGKAGASGIKTVLENLVKNQIALGNTVIVGVLSKDVGDKNESFMKPMSELQEFISYVTNLKPDVVIFHGVYYWQYIQFSKYCKRHKIKYLITFHGGDNSYTARKGYIKKKIADILSFNNFIRNASATIYLSEEEKSRALKTAINNRNLIIPNGINAKKTIEKHVCEDKIRVLFFGRIDYYHKGMDLLLDAIHKISCMPECRNIHFNICGPISSKSFKRDICGLNEVLSYYPPIYSDDAKESLYRSNDIFILTSRLEGMPMGVLEAMSYGLPCIITPNTNMVDLVKSNDAGWITPLEPSKIAESVIKAVSEYRENPVRYIRNSQNAVSQFEWGKVAKISLNAYSSAIK